MEFDKSHLGKVEKESSIDKKAQHYQREDWQYQNKYLPTIRIIFSLQNYNSGGYLLIYIDTTHRCRV